MLVNSVWNLKFQLKVYLSKCDTTSSCDMTNSSKLIIQKTCNCSLVNKYRTICSELQCGLIKPLLLSLRARETLKQPMNQPLASIFHHTAK